MPSGDFWPTFQNGYWSGATAATTLTNVIYTTGQTVIPWQPVPAAMPIPHTVPVVPDTPETWLRRRVKEVCELAAA